MTFFAVWDAVTANLLGEFDAEAAAEAYAEEIRPLGRYGPAGHDLIVVPVDEDDPDS